MRVCIIIRTYASDSGLHAVRGCWGKHVVRVHQTPRIHNSIRKQLANVCASPGVTYVGCLGLIDVDARSWCFCAICLQMFFPRIAVFW